MYITLLSPHHKAGTLHDAAAVLLYANYAN